MNRKELEAIWEEVHSDLPTDTSLHSAIITEGIGEEDEDSQGDIARRLHTLAEDITDLAGAVEGGVVA